MAIVLRSFVAVSLMSVLSGCVYLPVKSPERPGAEIGDGPQAVMHIGEADRETVLQRFGKPSYSTQNDRAFGYLFAVQTVTATGLVMGPCMPYIGKAEFWECDDVWLEFDGQGLLKRVEKRLLKKNDNDTEAAWRQFAKPVPDPIRLEQMIDEKP